MERVQVVTAKVIQPPGNGARSRNNNYICTCKYQQWYNYTACQHDKDTLHRKRIPNNIMYKHGNLNIKKKREKYYNKIGSNNNNHRHPHEMNIMFTLPMTMPTIITTTVTILIPKIIKTKQRLVILHEWPKKSQWCKFLKAKLCMIEHSHSADGQLLHATALGFVPAPDFFRIKFCADSIGRFSEAGLRE